MFKDMNAAFIELSIIELKKVLDIIDKKCSNRNWETIDDYKVWNGVFGVYCTLRALERGIKYEK